jgi:K+-transporting ATPase ATPase C chain
MNKHLLPALKATIVLAVLTGLIFPALITLIAQIVFPEQANGSLLRDKGGQVIGSRLIAQQFLQAKYFHARPSAAGAGYKGEASGGTNLGPTSSKLILGVADDPASKDIDESYAGIKQLAEQYRSENMLASDEKVPVDAVTRSASGLDPDISFANASLQARRVARARAMSEQDLLQLVRAQTASRQFDMFGEPRVNVLMLNLALDQAKQ